MPPKLLEAIREALASEAGWTFSHPEDRSGIERLLCAAGVERYVALPLCPSTGNCARVQRVGHERRGRVGGMAVPFATAHPDDVEGVMQAAFEAGAKGLRFQRPVQECGPDDPRLDPAFELAAAYDRPITFHAGTAPMFTESPHVGSDERCVRAFPRLLS